MRLIVALSSLVVAAAAGASSAKPWLQSNAPGRRTTAPAFSACFSPARGRRNAPSVPVGSASIRPSLKYDEKGLCSIPLGRTLLRSQRLASTDDDAVATRRLEEDGNDDDDDEEDGRRLSDAPPSKRDIVVSSSIDLPFPADIAFDAFADLPRQPTWSPWLRSVEYVDDVESAPICEVSGVPLREARWTMGYRGLRFSWNAVSTVLERPGRIDWESTSGLKNYGTVTFEEANEWEGDESVGAGARTKMTLSMKFRAPRVVASLLRRSDSIASLMEEKMLGETLHLFRDIVLAEDCSTSVGGQLSTKGKSQKA